MATDVADLGIRVDSTQVTSASKNLDQLSESGGKAAKSTSLFEKAWLDLTKGLAAYDILKKVVTSLYDSAIAAIFAGEHYARLAAIAGTTASAISAFEEPARKSGVAMDTIASSIARLGRSIGEARLGDQNQKLLLNALGISPGDQRDASAIFQDIGKTLIQMKDQTLASAAAFPLLGRNINELKPLFKEIAEQQRLTPIISETQAKQSKELADSWAVLKVRSEALAISLVSKSGLVPAMNEVIATFAKLSGPSVSGKIRTVDNIFDPSGNPPPPTKPGGSESALKKLLEDQKLYDSRIASLKGFTDQYMTAVKALNVLIETEDNNSVHKKEDQLQKQNDLNNAALQAQIAFLEKQRALAVGVGKTKEAEEYTQAIDNANAQIVANETITQARIRALRQEAARQGVEIYNQYISGLAQQGQALIDSFKSQREQEMANYKRQKDSLDAFFADNRDQYSNEYQIRERAELEHQARMGDIKAQGKLEAIKIEQMSGREQAEFYFGYLAQITQAASQHNLAMFRLNQVAGIANATISAYVGATKALEWGWPMGPIFAGIIIAAAAVNIRAIAQAKYGGGTSAPSVGGGSAIPTTPATPSAPPSQTSSGSQVGLTLIVQGNMIGNEDFVNTTLIPALQDAIGNRDVSIISPTSRQALELSGMRSQP